jgi:hypothetical protein
LLVVERRREGQSRRRALRAQAQALRNRHVFSMFKRPWTGSCSGKRHAGNPAWTAAVLARISRRRPMWQATTAVSLAPARGTTGKPVTMGSLIAGLWIPSDAEGRPPLLVAASVSKKDTLPGVPSSPCQTEASRDNVMDRLLGAQRPPSRHTHTHRHASGRHAMRPCQTRRFFGLPDTVLCKD